VDLHGHKKRSSMEAVRVLILNTPSLSRRKPALGSSNIVGADVACPTAGGASLELPPGAGMDGEGTPLSVGGGCE